jgi:hypothetical protein
MEIEGTNRKSRARRKGSFMGGKVERGTGRVHSWTAANSREGT